VLTDPEVRGLLPQLAIRLATYRDVE